MIELDPKKFRRCGYRVIEDRTYAIVWDNEGNELFRKDVTEQMNAWSDMIRDLAGNQTPCTESYSETAVIKDVQP